MEESLMSNQIFGLIMGITTCSLVTTIWISYPFHWVEFWNSIFVWSLLLLLIGSTMYIVQSGFFSHYMRNFRYFFRKVNRTKQLADQIEQKSYGMSSIPVLHPLTMPFIVTGTLLTLLASFVSFLLL